jgi:hypothetical protein
VKENAVALLGIVKLRRHFGPIAVFVVPREEIFRTALLMDRQHGEGSLVIGGGERVCEPAVVLRGVVSLPGIENGVEPLDLGSRELTAKETGNLAKSVKDV